MRTFDTTTIEYRTLYAAARHAMNSAVGPYLAAENRYFEECTEYGGPSDLLETRLNDTRMAHQAAYDAFHAMPVPAPYPRPLLFSVARR